MSSASGRVWSVPSAVPSGAFKPTVRMFNVSLPSSAAGSSHTTTPSTASPQPHPPATVPPSDPSSDAPSSSSSSAFDFGPHFIPPDVLQFAVGMGKGRPSHKPSTGASASSSGGGSGAGPPGVKKGPRRGINPLAPLSPQSPHSPLRSRQTDDDVAIPMSCAPTPMADAEELVDEDGGEDGGQVGQFSTENVRFSIGMGVAPSRKSRAGASKPKRTGSSRRPSSSSTSTFKPTTAGVPPPQPAPPAAAPPPPAVSASVPQASFGVPPPAPPAASTGTTAMPPSVPVSASTTASSSDAAVPQSAPDFVHGVPLFNVSLGTSASSKSRRNSRARRSSHRGSSASSAKPSSSRFAAAATTTTTTPTADSNGILPGGMPLPTAFEFAVGSDSSAFTSTTADTDSNPAPAPSPPTAAAAAAAATDDAVPDKVKGRTDTDDVPPPPGTVDPKDSIANRGVALRRLGTEMYKQGKYAAALAKYSEALECLPDDARLWCNRAAAFVMLDKLEDAISDCQKAAETDPTLTKAYVRAARAYMSLGRMERADSLVARAVSVATDTDAAAVRDLQTTVMAFNEAVRRAQALLDGRRYQAALSSSEKALAVCPLDVGATLLKVKALNALKRVRFVPEVCREILPPALMGANERAQFRGGLTSRQLELAVEYALALWCLEETHKAHSTIDAVLRASPSNTHARDVGNMMKTAERSKQAGNDAFRDGKYDDAIRMYTSVLDLLQKTQNMRLRGVLLSNRAAGHMAKRSFREAIADCTAALKLDTHHIKARLRRARSFVEVSEYDAAIRDFEQALGDMRESGKGSGKEYGSVVREKEKAKLARDSAYRQKQWRDEQKQYHQSYGFGAKPDAGGGGGGGGGPHGSTYSRARRPSHSRRGHHSGHHHAPPQPPPPPPPPPAAPPAAARPSHYDILGIAPSATSAQVKKAFHKLALKYHPDKVGTKLKAGSTSSPADVKAAEEKFKAVSEAYAVLFDASNRTKYDRELREATASRRGAGGGGSRKWWGW